MERKADDSPLTDADRRANDVIVRMLGTAFPDHAVLTEEAQDDPARLIREWCWIVDPLDGTKEFVKRNGEFTVNIGLAHQQRVVLGVIGVPVTGELYYAAEGLGAFRERTGTMRPGAAATMRAGTMRPGAGAAPGTVERLAVSDRRRSRLRLALSRSHAYDEADRLLDQNDIVEVRQVGSSLKGCLVAAGEAEVYVRSGPTMEWDTAAMQCIVEQAGGIVRQLDGTELLYNRADSCNHKGFYMCNHPDNRLVGVGAAAKTDEGSRKAG